MPVAQILRSLLPSFDTTKVTQYAISSLPCSVSSSAEMKLLLLLRSRCTHVRGGLVLTLSKETC